MHIALINNDNICYGSLLFFLQSIKDELDKLGHSTEIVTEIDDSFISTHWDAVIGINHDVFSAKYEDGSFIFDSLNCPIILLIVDSPYVHHNAIQSHPQNMHLICLDLNHAEYAQKYYGPFRSVSMGQLTGPLAPPIDYAKRSIDVLFPCTHTDLDEITNKILAYKTTWITDLYYFLIESGKKNPNMHTQPLVLYYFKTNNIDISKEDFKLAMAICGSYAEFYLRSFYREKIVTTLLDNNIKITVIGNGWKHILQDRLSQLTLIENISYFDISKYISDSKIVLNVMPWFKGGFHDRISTSMINGALCVTDSSSYIESKFENKKDLVIYDLCNLETLPSSITELLTDSSYASMIANCGKEKAVLHYTFKNFVHNNILPLI